MCLKYNPRPHLPHPPPPMFSIHIVKLLQNSMLKTIVSLHWMINNKTEPTYNIETYAIVWECNPLNEESFMIQLTPVFYSYFVNHFIHIFFNFAIVSISNFLQTNTCVKPSLKLDFIWMHIVQFPFFFFRE